MCEKLLIESNNKSNVRRVENLFYYLSLLNKQPHLKAVINFIIIIRKRRTKLRSPNMHDLRRDESTGQPVFSVDFKNTYYHLDVSHVRHKNPYFDGKVTVSFTQYHSFDSAQNARISSSSGFQIMLT